MPKYVFTTFFRAVSGAQATGKRENQMISPKHDGIHLNQILFSQFDCNMINSTFVAAPDGLLAPSVALLVRVSGYEIRGC